MKPTVLLFDIDGTLISTGGAGRRAVDAAFAECHGRADACTAFSFAGMTDRAIVRQGLQTLGAEVDDSKVDVVIDVYLRHLEREVQRMEAARYVVHAGMVEAVHAGLGAGFAVGLGTGNVKRGAEIKLRRVGLDVHFRFGGFGDDHELRPELIRRGAERGAAQLGVALSEARVVVIGDTPKDVSAAQAIGAESVGVATGDFSVEALRACGATWAFSDLASPEAREVLLRGARG
ncbi:MAG: haloacid dehalogenase-like hydrolase [Archangium sp.]|nr:haloacid dehalogenase-like hydrolase [Archangium sp.]